MKNNKLNTALLVVIAILLAIIVVYLVNSYKVKSNSPIPTPNTPQVPETPSPKSPETPKVPTTPKKDVVSTAPTVLQNIFNTYKNGMIEECSMNGQIYYSVSSNGYDAGGSTYDSNGNVVGTYQGFTGKYTGITPVNCTNIYVVSPNVWGYPAINKYNLK